MSAMVTKACRLRWTQGRVDALEELAEQQIHFQHRAPGAAPAQAVELFPIVHQMARRTIIP
jgi:hypothetical protein